tara:strand:+ start:367 stop:567 length:201 start_codon:yes stop_codon:yes gene_type:complete
MTTETVVKQLTGIVDDIQKALGHQMKFNNTQFKVNEKNIELINVLKDKIIRLEEKIVNLEEGRSYL